MEAIFQKLYELAEQLLSEYAEADCVPSCMVTDRVRNAFPEADVAECVALSSEVFSFMYEIEKENR